MDDEILRLRSHGHPAVRGTHGKTLEFAVEPDITARATCVLGVATTVLGDPVPPVAGPLRLTITARGISATVHALGNSLWRPGTTAVVRRSAERLPNTLATDADTAAADLPRELVHALTDPDTEVDVQVERAPGPEHGTLVRYWAAPGHDPRLAVECAAADVILAEDREARAALAAYDALGASGASGARPTRSARDAEAAAREALAEGGRILTVAAAAVPGPLPPLFEKTARPTVEALNLPPELALSVVSPVRAERLLATEVPPREVPRLVAAHPGAAVTFRCAAEELPRVLAEVDRPAGSRTVGVAEASLPGAERPWWGPVAELDWSGRGEVVCQVDPVETPAGAGVTAVDPAGLVAALLEQSVSTRTIAMALAAQPGWSRRTAYDFVLKATGGQKS
uniref:IstA protein n=1 Tax=Streptomyces tenjimariensis TaxID=29308 RepID=Q2UZE3_9ACTN|nr:IstA protein [Streptomyces tenjimariensis]